MRWSITWNSTYDCDDVTVTFFNDGKIIAQSACSAHSHTVEFDIEDHRGDHLMEICVQGKTHEHTDPDLLINIEKVQIEDIDFTGRFYEISEYTHDFNGSGDVVSEKFYRSLGCNGSVKLGYSTPLCLWLLEYL